MDSLTCLQGGTCTAFNGSSIWEQVLVFRHCHWQSCSLTCNWFPWIPRAKRSNSSPQLPPRWASDNVNPLVGRAEELGQDPQHRQRYDRVVVRAVAALPILAELALPLLRENGLLVAQKGPISSEELNAGRRASGEVGGKVQVVDPFTLPILGDARTLIVIEKLKPTPAKYPRRPGVPNPQPLFWNGNT